MPTGKTKSRCAWETVNRPAIRCLYTILFGYENGNRNPAKRLSCKVLLNNCRS